MGSHRSNRSTRSSKAWPHHKPAKSRAKLNEKITWNGYGETFLTFSRVIEGHLLQVGAGYLLDTHFLYHYALSPRNCQLAALFHNTSEVWIYHKVSCHQIKYDTEYLYGILVSATRNITNKIIIKHDKDRDGIIAWSEFRQDFDNDGSKSLREQAVGEIVSTAYQPNQAGGLALYLDKFLAAVHELEILTGEDFTENHKKRTLIQNVSEIPFSLHQKVRDDREYMTFASI